MVNGGLLGLYSLSLTDTVSSSWQDDGVDSLTDGGSLTGQADSFHWNQFNSLTDSVSLGPNGPWLTRRLAILQHGRNRLRVARARPV